MECGTYVNAFILISSGRLWGRTTYTYMYMYSTQTCCNNFVEVM